MKIDPVAGSAPFGEPGVFRGQMTFSNPTLADYRWPLCEIRGKAPGPRLCVTAGVHVNEVSSIEAAVRLQGLFDVETMKGTVSIIPVANQPAYDQFTEYNCPIDGKNINFTFPGKPDGTFSEALCDALQNEWAAGADCYIDLHGGDLRENVSKFVMFQRTDDTEADALRERLARCFDAEIVMALPKKLMEQPGRPPTGFARQGRIAIMPEAGANGMRDEVCINYHVDGVLNIAGELGIVERKPQFNRARVLCQDYLWVESPAAGQFTPLIEPGDAVVKGQDLGPIHDLFGQHVGNVFSPADGLILWRMTHPTVFTGMLVLAVAVPA